MKQLSSSQHYAKLRKAIAGELLSGAERVRRSYREEIVRTTWNIGRILRGTMGLVDQPHAGNAAIVARLSRDLGRPDSFFYDAAKFHRLYPGKVPLQLSMSHYACLIRLEDPRKRLALERKALKEGINAKDFRIYTRLPYDFTHPTPGVAFNGSRRAVLPVERGRLYHYQTTKSPLNGRVLISLGFGIERDVRSTAQESRHAGLILRVIKIGNSDALSPNLENPKPRHDGGKVIPQDDGELHRSRVTVTDDQKGEDYATRISPYDKKRLYTYAATLVRVIDGDTIVARVDLGFRTWILQTFRLRGIDAPEVTCALGRKAKIEVLARLKPCACLVIKSYKQEKFGRYLADVFYKKEAGEAREQILNDGAFLNQELLDEGLAVVYEEPRNISVQGAGEITVNGLEG